MSSFVYIFVEKFFKRGIMSDLKILENGKLQKNKLF